MSEKECDARLGQTKGSLKEGFGKVTGDRKLEAEGFARKTIAKGKELANDVKESMEGAVEGVRKALHKDN